MLSLFRGIRRQASQLAAIFAVTAAWLTMAATPAAADACSDLASRHLAAGVINSAELVAPGTFHDPSPMMGPPGMGNPFASMPAFCRVRATLTPSSDSDIKIEVWLPAENWNGKFVGVGNGVWAGTIGYGSMAGPVSEGYAVGATDTGHVGNGMDASFAQGHPEKLIDFGYRAVHEMTVNAKDILAAFYGRRPDYSYWNSCSTGGRQGLMEAFRYPDDYDAISAMAPANPMTDLMIQTIWTGYAALRTPESALGPQKFAAVHQAFVRACDALDGLSDGLVSDVAQCRFDPASMLCHGADQPDCLTAPQVATMRAIYEGPNNTNARARGLGGFSPGSEFQLMALTGGPAPFPVATSYMSIVVFKDANWDFRSFDYNRDSDLARAAGSDILDAHADGLAPFFARGGKLLLSHGWSDGLIPAGFTVAFYNSMMHSTPAAANQARLFMVPGMGHCGGGDGPFVFDTLSIINQWATSGVAPERIVAVRPPAGPGQSPSMPRPLCPYPMVARYDGEGSTDSADSFRCVAP